LDFLLFSFVFDFFSLIIGKVVKHACCWPITVWWWGWTIATSFWIDRGFLLLALCCSSRFSWNVSVSCLFTLGIRSILIGLHLLKIEMKKYY
jgi:hypothetical protein